MSIIETEVEVNGRVLMHAHSGKSLQVQSIIGDLPLAWTHFRLNKKGNLSSW